MDTALAIITYDVSFFSDRETSLTITREQYEGKEGRPGLRDLLKDHRFIEINGSMYNTADIKAVLRKESKEKEPFVYATIGKRKITDPKEYDAWLRGEDI